MSSSNTASSSATVAVPGAGTNGRPIVFMDISIGDTPAGRLKFELFSDIVPRTTENFRQLCTGEFRPNHVPEGYKNTIFHRIIKDFMCQGGDYLHADGTGSRSIYGDKFEDENFTLKHDQAGLLSMANSGPGTNGCQFFITAQPCPFLDGKHVVFGKVVDGLLTLRKMENVSTGANNRPKMAVRVTPDRALRLPKEDVFGDEKDCAERHRRSEEDLRQGSYREQHATGHLGPSGIGDLDDSTSPLLSSKYDSVLLTSTLAGKTACIVDMPLSRRGREQRR